MSEKTKGKLAEILESGRAPGFAGIAVDERSPEKSVPRALKQIEATRSGNSIAKEMGFSVNHIKRIWGI